MSHNINLLYKYEFQYIIDKFIQFSNIFYKYLLMNCHLYVYNTRVKII